MRCKDRHTYLWRFADNPKSLNLCGSVAIAAAANDGAMPTFEGNAYTGAPMRPEGWWTPVIIDLEGVVIPSQHRPALRQHDHEKIVGHTTEVKASKTGIMVKGIFSGQKEHVDTVVIPARNGFQWQMSVGANPIRTEYLEPGKKTSVNGRPVVGPMTISRETEVGEVSFVPLGADGKTSATVAASKGDNMNPFKAALKELMGELRAAGKLELAKYSDAEIDEMTADVARANLKKCMKASKEDDEDDDDEDDKKNSKSQLANDLKAELEKGLAHYRQVTAAEQVRQSAITATCRKYGIFECEIEENGAKKRVNLAAHAISENWTTDKTELTALRLERPGRGVGVAGGLSYSTTSPEVDERVLEAAVFHAARHEFRLEDDSFYFDRVGEHTLRRVPEYVQRDMQRDFKARYTDQVQQAAHTLFKGRISLSRLMVSAARINGYQGTDKLDDSSGPEILRFAAGPRMGGMGLGIQAEGVSTASIANILANVLNKFAGQGYLFVEQAWREVSAIRPVNDFKPTKTINLLGDVEYKLVASSGELRDASLSDQAFANQADQYGRIITINRKNLINDDLGILTTVPIKIGQGAGLALNKVFWTAFLGLADPVLTTGTLADDGNYFWNSTGSPATHGTAPANQVAAGPNYFSGSTTNLSSTSLQTAKQLFDRQTDPNGNPLGFDSMTPNLLFPPELWLTAIELVDPSAIGLVYGGSTAARQPNINLWKGRLKPVMSRYLSNANYTGYSTTAWYVLFNPVALAVMEVAFLNGADVPTVQIAGQDFQFDRLGISARGIMDFGVNAQNFRGGVKSKGAA